MKQQSCDIRFFTRAMNVQLILGDFNCFHNYDWNRIQVIYWRFYRKKTSMRICISHRCCCRSNTAHKTQNWGLINWKTETSKQSCHQSSWAKLIFKRKTRSMNTTLSRDIKFNTPSPVLRDGWDWVQRKFTNFSFDLDPGRVPPTKPLGVGVILVSFNGNRSFWIFTDAH